MFHVCLLLVLFTWLSTTVRAEIIGGDYAQVSPGDTVDYVDPASEENPVEPEKDPVEPDPVEENGDDEDDDNNSQQAQPQVADDSQKGSEVSFEIIEDNGEDVFLLYVGKSVFAGSVVYDRDDLSLFPVSDFVIFAMQESSEGYHFQVNVNVNLTIIYSVAFYRDAAPGRQTYDFLASNVSPMGLELVYWYTTRAYTVVIELWDYNYDSHRQGTVRGTISTSYGKTKTDSKTYLVSPWAHTNTIVQFINYPQQWAGMEATLTLQFRDNKETWYIERRITL